MPVIEAPKLKPLLKPLDTGGPGRLELAIIGGGPAGLTAAIYACRANISSLLFEKGVAGGQVAMIDEIENFPGFPGGVSGYELAEKMVKQAKDLGAMVAYEEVSELTVDQKHIKLKTRNKTYQVKAAIIAAGAAPQKLDLPGEARLLGRGVSYCAVCDGAFYPDKEIIVVGGGDSAVSEALYLTRFGRRVTIVHRRDTLRATQVLQERAQLEPKIKIVWNSLLKEIKGETKVSSVVLTNVKTKQDSELPADAVFIYVGTIPNSKFCLNTVQLDDHGFVTADAKMNTNIPGIFAAGDIRAGSVRQISAAVGDGATAALAAIDYLANWKP